MLLIARCGLAAVLVVALTMQSAAARRPRVHPADVIPEKWWGPTGPSPPYGNDQVTLYLLREDLMDEFWGRGGAGNDAHDMCI